MKTTVGCLSFALLALRTFAQAPDAAYAHSAGDQTSWVIGNDRVEREIRFDPQRGLYTAAWRHKVTGTDFMAQPAAQAAWGAEFSFQAGPTRLAGAGSGFELQEARISDAAPRGKLLAVRLRSKTQPIEVTVFYAVYAGHPVVRKWLAIHNQGPAPIVLTHLVFESVNLAPTASADTQVSGFYGVEPKEIFFTGRVDDPAILVRSSKSHEGFMVMNEAPGYL